MDPLEQKPKKTRSPKKPKSEKVLEEVTSSMVSDQFDKVYNELKKLESYIFKPIVEPVGVEMVIEPVVPPLLIPPVKKVRAKKALNIIPVEI